MSHEQSEQYDVLIVGGGAAGLSAALVLSRALRRVVVIDAGSPRNAPAAHMHGYLSREGQPPAELLDIGRSEVRGYGGTIVSGTVTTLDGDLESGFGVVLADGRQLSGRRVLVTTGLRDVLPSVPGISERWGRDVLHCPYCHGWEVRDQPVGVLGGTPEAVQHAQLVRQWCPDVVIFTHGDALTSEQRMQLTARHIRIVDGPVRRLIITDDEISGVQLETGQVVRRNAIFVRPRFAANSDLLSSIGCACTEDGWVRTNDVSGTSVPGVWAAGNAVNPRAQVITAAGEGSTAAIAINNDLVIDDIRRAARDLV
ncbi:NAD(P)/FAD-dependent oxidoreductase [Salinibacterium sp. ZJ450]|uniref:NAD(P)/FAD-dependent oxidoreductase n=1 Tax=Salinibacterium sp. ZJ450 TaxID=2708338 RepID=UPI001422CB5D|nr:NAD(P)/FAD-dependent oxidoreductase [Salinibacterium sp. ZJ450]